MTTIDVPGLTHRVLDTSASEEGHPDRALLHGWGEALARGFNEGRTTDEHRAVWIAGARDDDMRLSGFWPERTAVAGATLPLATFASWTGGPLNVGDGRALALHMITDVTVSPTHRRRGLLRTMMTDDLATAAERGRAVAALTATEGGIYGRFGFGPATQLRTVEVDVTERFRLRPFTDDGSLELVEPAEAWGALKDVHEARVRSTRGALSWPAFYESLLTGRFNWHEGGPDRASRVVLHLDAGGRPDGFATYKHVGESDGRRTVEVDQVTCASAGGYLALWQLLAGIDLTERVRWARAPVVDPLAWALTDPRCVRTTTVNDMLWVRVLDVVVALEARPWYADGSIVLGVDDPLGLIDGCWRVEVVDGRAAVTRTQDVADVSLTAETLGALYLGGVATATLRAAARLGGSEAELDRWATMVDGGPAPYCTTGF